MTKNEAPRFAQLSDFELAALFHDVATWRPTSQDEAFQKGDELEAIGAAMDARGVRLEDWDVSYR